MAILWQWLKRCIPSPMILNPKDYWLAPLGAFIAILGTGYLSYYLLGFNNPWLIAPMGASAVLLFVIPASPLAQPWAVIGGNFISASVGVISAHLVTSTPVASAIAVGMAIAIMMRLRCLHPPSGAVALMAVLGGPSITQLGYQFAISPVLINSVMLVAFAIVYHQFSRHTYPHQIKVKTSSQAEITLDDVESALRQHHELLDIDENDLLNIVQETERIAKNRLMK